MSKNNLMLIGSLIATTIVVLGCRPKKRPQNVIGNSPTLLVSISGMPEFGEPDYSYHLSGTGCAEAEGTVEKGLHGVMFKDRRLKKGLGGCVVLVRGTNQPSGIKYTRIDGVLYVSNEFVISHNESNKMVAEAILEPIFKLPKKGGSPVPGAPDPGHYNLKVSMELPPETEVEKFSKTEGVLTCSEPLGLIAMNDLKFDQNRRVSYIREDIKLEANRDTITCSNLTVKAKVGTVEIKFSRDLKNQNSFIPVSGKTMSLNGGNSYQLSLISGTVPGTGIQVNISQCPADAPWLDTSIQNPVCKPCPPEAPYFREVLQRCVK